MAEDPSPPPAAAAGPARRRSRVEAVDLAVSRRLRRRRLELGMTLQRLAERVGVTYQQAHKYEAGLNRLSAGRLHRIAEALKVDVGYFFADVHPEGRGGAEPDEAGRGQRRKLFGLVRHAACIRDPGHREALCRLARELATFGAGVPDDPQVERPRSQHGPQSGPIR
jgi:transcriptional regulator with XRE-family HTH domain